MKTLFPKKYIPRKMFNKLSYKSQLICDTALSFIWKNIHQLIYYQKMGLQKNQFKLCFENNPRRGPMMF